MIDFVNSYMTFFGKNNGNIARIQLDAACTLIEEASGAERVFYLIAPCRAERMYGDGALFQMPNYEFCGIFADDEELMLVRTAWVSERDNREPARKRERFDDVTLDIVTLPSQQLADDAAIVAATLANRPLVARTEIQTEGGARRAVLEYPVKTMNVLREPPRFQVDTGPLILPDLASTGPAIESFDLAHVVYCLLDRAEFVLRRPNPVGPTGTLVTDYSLIQIMPAANSIHTTA
jgi:hypothetical protein